MPRMAPMKWYTMKTIVYVTRTISCLSLDFTTRYKMTVLRGLRVGAEVTQLPRTLKNFIANK